jgi:hypothetical protein
MSEQGRIGFGERQVSKYMLLRAVHVKPKLFFESVNLSELNTIKIIEIDDYTFWCEDIYLSYIPTVGDCL